MPPLSPIAASTPANRLGWARTSQRAPNRPPASSSARNAKTMSRSGCTPSRAHRSSVARDAAHMSFMSAAPRPQTYPSSTTPANGSTDQSSGAAGTTSRCPWTSSAGRARSTPGTRSTTLARSGASSRASTSGDQPAATSRSAIQVAAFRSPALRPRPQFVVSNRISVDNRSTTSPPDPTSLEDPSAASVHGSAVISSTVTGVRKRYRRLEHLLRGPDDDRQPEQDQDEGEATANPT